MTTQGTISLQDISDRIAELHHQMPSIPAILLPLLRLLEVAPESVDVQRIVELIGHDKSLAAQTLHMANSPLFGRWQNVCTIRGAVLALGVDRVRDIVATCCILKLVPESHGSFDIRVLWEHSLGVALVSRRFARRIGYPSPEQAYLAGLLHDIGLVVNLTLIRERFLEVAERARNERVGFGEIEETIIGFNHSVSGGILAEDWSLTSELKEVIRRHHQFDRAEAHLDLVALVNIGDLLCRTRGLGYGYGESRTVRFADEPGWQHLAGKFPVLWQTDLEKLSCGLDGYIEEVRSLVSALFRMQ